MVAGVDLFFTARGLLNKFQQRRRIFQAVRVMPHARLVDDLDEAA